MRNELVARKALMVTTQDMDPIGEIFVPLGDAPVRFSPAPGTSLTVDSLRDIIDFMVDARGSE